MKQDQKQFPCDYCKDQCPTRGTECPAVKDLGRFLNQVPEEKQQEAIEAYLSLVGLEPIA